MTDVPRPGVKALGKIHQPLVNRANSQLKAVYVVAENDAPRWKLSGDYCSSSMFRDSPSFARSDGASHLRTNKIGIIGLKAEKGVFLHW